MQKKMTKKFWAVLVSLLLICAVGLGGTIAFLATDSNTVTNTFVTPKSDITVDEDFDGKVKSEVSVKNDSEYPVYIRAKVVVNWATEAGDILGDAPVLDEDYTLTLAEKTGWFLDEDGYYYYSAKVAEGANTDILISECQPVAGKTPEGYHLQVEILAESIQAIPDRAVVDAWGVTVADNGTISK